MLIKKIQGMLNIFTFCLKKNLLFLREGVDPPPPIGDMSTKNSNFFSMQFLKTFIEETVKLGEKTISLGLTEILDQLGNFADSLKIYNSNRKKKNLNNIALIL